MSWTCLCPHDHPDRIPVCSACLMDRPAGEAPGSLKYRCASCNEATRIVQLTTGDDGRERCASCHVAFLRERAERHPVSPSDRLRFTADLEAAYRNAEAKWGTMRR